MNFSEALQALKNGKKITREAFKDYAYLFIEDKVLKLRTFVEREEIIVYNTRHYMLSDYDLFTEDWEIVKC